MILDLAGTAIATALVVAPTAGYLGAKFRERIPIRIPTNRTRIDDAQTDLKLMEIGRERRQIDYNIERDRLLAERELAVAQRELAETERREIAAVEGENHLILEARLLDAARRAFPDAPWGTAGSADDALDLLDRCIRDLRASESSAREKTETMRAAVGRARLNGRLPKYLSDAAYDAGLL